MHKGTLRTNSITLILKDLQRLPVNPNIKFKKNLERLYKTVNNMAPTVAILRIVRVCCNLIDLKVFDHDKKNPTLSLFMIHLPLPLSWLWYMYNHVQSFQMVPECGKKLRTPQTTFKVSFCLNSFKLKSFILTVFLDQYWNFQILVILCTVTVCFVRVISFFCVFYAI